jgi:hypothetical protein
MAQDGKAEIKLTVPPGTSAQFSPAGKIKKSWEVVDLKTMKSSFCHPTRMVVVFPEGCYLIK